MLNSYPPKFQPTGTKLEILSDFGTKIVSLHAFHLWTQDTCNIQSLTALQDQEWAFLLVVCNLMHCDNKPLQTQCLKLIVAQLPLVTRNGAGPANLTLGK